MPSVIHVIRAAMLAAFLVGCANPEPSDAATTGSDLIIARIDAALAENDIPGAIVLLDIEGSRMTIARGVANRETGLAMQTTHLMRAASVGKLHTAAVIHQLILNGELSLDMKLADVVEAHWLEDIANADQATIRQLLNHTSGIPDYYDDGWFAHVNTVDGNTPERTLAHIRGAAADFPPGTDHAYSNTNYQYLALAAEAVTGQSIDALYRELVFEPLGLSATGYNIQFDPADRIHGYGSELDPEQDAFELLENNGPDGGIFTTADELADFLAALFDDDGRLHPIGASMMSDLHDRGDGRYRALGPTYVEHPLGFTAVTHGGSIAGYGTIAIRLLSQDATVIVHLNRDRSDIAGQLAQQILLEALTGTAN
ncbi:serine hydrolase domain-containing protein [Maricaulis sp.]|uniref:serine hydrolase domain-containing protein n=1 Tax=Maricaulis sp. TaxID=1486257 RepID=UPI002B26A7C1|nr:serine hydrolase domain-containing protein [Maricaulis sp.]